MAITITYTFTPNTTALSAEVNANFSLLASRATDKTGDTLTGTLATQILQPSTTNTYDLGTTGLFYRTGYVKTSLVLGQTTANYTLTWANPAAARAISFEDPLGTDIIAYKAATQTFTNKTLSAPVLSGTATGSYTMGGTGIWNAGAVTSSGAFTSSTSAALTGTTNNLGTITTGVWNAGAITTSGLVTASGFGQHNYYAAGTGENSINVRNTTAGTGNYSVVGLGNDTAAQRGTLLMASSTYTPTIYYRADGLALVASGAGGMSLATPHASGYIGVYTGGTSETARFHASRGVSIGDTTDPGATNFRVAGTSALVGNTVITADAKFGTSSNFSWNTKSMDTAYQAASDGLVIVSAQLSNSGAIEFYSDVNASPTTLRGTIKNPVVSNDVYSMTIPVKKSDYYKVVTNTGGGSVTILTGPYWIPLGTAG